MPTTTGEIQARGMTFRCRFAGDAGEPVILLHGFPETSHMWAGLLPALEAAGYRCVAPDQRGYSPGARPEGIPNYSYRAIGSDVFAIADACGFDRFHLIGHDWGAGAGWAAVALDPGRIQSWTALSVPHIASFGSAIRADDDQRQKSQYITFFQEPGVAEAALSADGFEPLKRIWSESSPGEIEEYISVFRQPGALAAALNWYRGSRGVDPADPEVLFGPVDTPTLLIWGNRDMAIGRTAVEGAARFMTGPYRLVELDAGHWLMQEAPGRVTAEILAHLQANRIG
ncbi:alpha/beta hydrolase [bacterium]|nr:MAG: alpha/beta hydrolase [bacterium]MCL4231524.1 alpha/beta hydrolase [Dehalococcoidia bacterium]